MALDPNRTVGSRENQGFLAKVEICYLELGELGTFDCQDMYTLCLADLPETGVK